LKKKSKSPLNLLVANLVGEKLARRMQQPDATELVNSISLDHNSFHRVRRNNP